VSSAGIRNAQMMRVALERGRLTILGKDSPLYDESEPVTVITFNDDSRFIVSDNFQQHLPPCGQDYLNDAIRSMIS
jgi:hypothetical protein